MYPISAEEKLRFYEIAYHWAIEIGHADSTILLRIPIRAWWGGEFGPTEAERRVATLKALYKHNQDVVLFVVQGRDELESKRELPDGGVEVFRLYRVSLPNDDPISWTEANCAEAFKVLAENWISDWIPDVSDTLSLLSLTEAIFTRWVCTRGYDRPKFWAERMSPDRSYPTADSKAPPVSTGKRRGPPAIQRNRVKRAMRAHIDDGTTTLEKLVEQKQESLAATYNCNRETARKALDELTAELNPRQIPTNDK